MRAEVECVTQLNWCVKGKEAKNKTRYPIFGQAKGKEESGSGRKISGQCAGQTLRLTASLRFQKTKRLDPKI